MSIEEVAATIYSKRTESHPKVPYRSEVQDFCERILSVLFPHFCEDSFRSPEAVKGELLGLAELVTLALSRQGETSRGKAEEAFSGLIEQLPALLEALLIDGEFIRDGDPAALDVDEVIAAYPGFQAIALYRIANFFLKQDIPVFARAITEYAHRMTGIDIHPGATIGSPFFIDHGTGIVVGESTVIGDRVKIYQGVTLGALSVEKSLASTKRHPTIEDDVVIYANATILGGKTKIGKKSIIGGNVWITESVPPHSRVYHKGELIIRQDAPTSE